MSSHQESECTSHSRVSEGGSEWVHIKRATVYLESVIFVITTIIAITAIIRTMVITSNTMLTLTNH